MPQAKPAPTSLIFLLLAVGTGSISMLQSLVSPVLPTLERELNTTQSAVSWVLIAYLLSLAVATPILGRVGDMIGKARTLVMALGVCAVGNLIAALAPNIEVLIVGRLVQGFGAGVFPLAFGILRDEFPAARIPSAIGSLSSVIAVGGGVGAVLAGPLVGLLGWRWLFWLPMIVLLIVAVLSKRYIPESTVRSGGRISWFAGVLLAGWLVALLLPLSQGTQWGWASTSVIGLFIAAALLFVGWFMVETRSSNPLIDMQMMRLGPVWKTNLVAVLFGAAMFAVLAFLPQLIQIPAEAGYGFGATITQAGWVVLPLLITMAIAGTISGRLAPAISFKTQLAFGSALVALSCLGFAFLHASIWQLVISSAVFGTGLGFAYSTMTNIIVQAVPATQTGAANGMNANIRTIGGAIGTAIMTAIVTAHRQPAGYPEEQGFTTGFAIFAVVSAVAIVVSLSLPNEKVSREATLLDRGMDSGNR